MGNNNTRESRPLGGTDVHDTYRSGDGRTRSRQNRGEGPFINLTSAQRDRARQNVPFEHRETKQEREARRLERERAARVKERERSLREEHVDGGYLVTLGTYTGTEDFSKPVVRQLQIDRKLAPFWRGLNDWSDSWAEHQLVAAARGLPIPAADEPPPAELTPQAAHARKSSQTNLQNLTVPLGERTMSAASDQSGSGTASGPASPGTSTKNSSSIKPRAKALAMALTGHSRNASYSDFAPVETVLPHDPFVNGQLLEIYLYKDATECPICFLSYPPYLNSTRCCDQAICTECFVQIKRADPHLPEHHPDGQVRDPNQELAPEDPPEMLISEPSACPYCQQPEFGVTYDPPPFRRGIVYSTSSTNLASSSAMSPMSSQSSLHSAATPNQAPPAGRRRGHSLSANAPNVITTDRIRPDWSSKLASVRAHQARRAAAATALHTAAFLVGGNEQRSILRSGRFGRRNTGSDSGTPQHGSVIVEGPDAMDSSERAAGGLTSEGGRRSRMDELEDMMFMEAVRLSLAAEEDRKKKEAKALRKDAKKREQADKKAAKKAAKDPYGGSISGASGSSLSLGLGRKRGNSGASNLRVEATVQGASRNFKSESSTDASSQVSHDDNISDSQGKGKSVDRSAETQTESSAGSGSLPLPIRSGGSHLRQISNASSVGSSVAGSAPGSHTDGGAPQLSVDTRDDQDLYEPMFNFRSLAEVVGVNIDDGTPTSKEGSGREESARTDNQEESGRPLSQVKEEEGQEELASAEAAQPSEPTEKPTSEPAEKTSPGPTEKSTTEAKTEETPKSEASPTSS